MRPLLPILDDWEGLIQSSSCWNRISDLADIKFLKKPIGQTGNKASS
ncbi:MAG TPA: hypothetical protein VMI35_07185 [Puia sp.]|nr:hypothetical protein [Puia sp.]